MYKLSKNNYIWKAEDNSWFIYNSVSNALITVDNEMYQLLLNKEVDENYEEFKTLIESYILIDVDAKEKNIYCTEHNLQRFSNSHMGAFILPTRACNLMCSYCIQNHFFDMYENVTMSDDTLDNIYKWVKTMVSRFKPESFTFLFYGGEPTTQPDFLKKVVDKMKDLNTKVRYRMITNGVNIPNVSLEVLNVIENIQITIDGPKKYHDSRRIKKDSSGTYDQILNAIKFYIDNTESQGSITIRVNVDKENRNSLNELIEELANREILTKGVSLYLAPTDPWEKGMTDEDVHGDIIDTAEAICNAYEIGMEYGVKPYTWNSNCGIDSTAMWVFDTDGYIYKCPALAGKIEKAVSNVDSFNFTSEFYYIMDSEIDDECYECSFLGICDGGCKQQAIMQGKKVCRKSFFEYLVRRNYNIIYGKELKTTC